jgi:hypothetical protein
MSKDSLIVYWSPYSSADVKELGEWNLMYPDPVNLFDELIKRRTVDAKDRSPWSYLSCPAAAKRLKNTYVFKSSMSCRYYYDFTDPDNPIIQPQTEQYYQFEVRRKPVLEDGPVITLLIQHLFFSEESVEPLFGPPTMYRPEYQNYGTSIPGSFDVSKWFRPHVFEIQLWNKRGYLEIKEGEPLFAVEFTENRDIELKRFVCNNNLISYSNSCVQSTKMFGSFLPLVKKYDQFKKSQMDKLILKEIKNNLVD